MEDRKALRPARRTLRDESCPSEMYRRIKYNASPKIPINIRVLVLLKKSTRVVKLQVKTQHSCFDKNEPVIAVIQRKV